MLSNQPAAPCRVLLFRACVHTNSNRVRNSEWYVSLPRQPADGGHTTVATIADFRGISLVQSAQNRHTPLCNSSTRCTASGGPAASD